MIFHKLRFYEIYLNLQKIWLFISLYKCAGEDGKMQCNYGVGSSWPSEKFAFTIFDRIRSVLYDYYTHTHTHLFVIIHVGEGSHYILCMYFSVFCILSWKQLETHSCAWATFDIVLYLLLSISTECVTKWVYHTLGSSGRAKGLWGGGNCPPPPPPEIFFNFLLVRMNQQNVILHRQSI